YVRDRMNRPGVATIGVERAATDVLRSRIQRSLLQPERIHTQHVAVARRAGVPGWQHLRDPDAEHRGRAEKEVADVRDLQRQEVLRMVQQDLAVAVNGTGEVALQPGTGGGSMGPLTI